MGGICKLGRGQKCGGGGNKFKCVHMNTVLGLLGNMFVKKHKEPLCTPPIPGKIGGRGRDDIHFQKFWCLRGTKIERKFKIHELNPKVRSSSVLMA